MGSNGLTSARHDVFEKYLATSTRKVWRGGSRRLDLLRTGKTDGCRRKSPIDAGQLVLSPTRTYAPIIKKILDKYDAIIHGMVHCSGGAQTKFFIS
jgi:phosphoribosylformylglycinamidine cyclo-ligase